MCRIPLGAVGGSSEELDGGHRVSGKLHAMHLPANQLLADRFELRRRIGVGPEGTVFAALDRATGKDVALKILRPDALDGAYVETCLAEEIEHASSLNHGGIVQVHPLERDGDLRFIPMELHEGTTLRHELTAMRTDGRRFPVAEVVRVGVALCSALAYAHQQMVHRGIKPENILLCDDGAVKLMDFGMTPRRSTEQNGVIGTSVLAAPYLAPEQFSEQSHTDHRTDQYATGAVLYEMLTGEAPVGRTRTARERRGETPRALSRALDRALEPNPDDRFGDISTFVKAFADSSAARRPRVRFMIVALAVLSITVAGAAFERWRAPVGLMVREFLRDPEKHALAESIRLQAMAAASNWRRIAELLPDEQSSSTADAAPEALSEGDRHLAALDYDRAADSFGQAFKLFEDQIFIATQRIRDEPSRVAEIARTMRAALGAREHVLYDRVAEAARHVDACAQTLRGARTADERAAMQSRHRDAEAELALTERLLTLTRENVFDTSTRDAIALALEHADQSLEEGHYRDALSAYAHTRDRLSELTAWPDRVESALRSESSLLQRIERSASELGPIASSLPNVQSMLDSAANQAARGATELADGRVVDALALIESTNDALSARTELAVAGLLEHARVCERDGRRTAAILALDELLALKPNDSPGGALRSTILSERLSNSLGMEFVFIPPGTFEMGSSPEEAGRGEDERRRSATIGGGFYLGTTEVTQSQWRAVMSGSPSRWEGDGLPVENVSWQDAVSFCRRLGEAEGGQYRLPSEMEWEYACRAGTTGPFSFGETISSSQANYDGNHAYGSGSKGVLRGKTVAVGSFAPNAWGLHDMHGNVWEWCSDLQALNPQAPLREADRKKPIERRVLRGGSWRHRPEFCRCANRVRGAADSRLDTIGFRVVLESD